VSLRPEEDFELSRGPQAEGSAERGKWTPFDSTQDRRFEFVFDIDQHGSSSLANRQSEGRVTWDWRDVREPRRTSECLPFTVLSGR
jgi:hypothetical protein